MNVDKGGAAALDRGGPTAAAQDELSRLYDRAFSLYSGDPRAAIALSEELCAKAAEAKSPYWQSLSRYTAGFSHYILSEYDKAMEEFDRGDQIAQEGSLIRLSVKFRNGYGVIYGRIGWYDKATEQFGEGLRLARELGLKRETGSFLVNLGELFLRLGNKAEALAFETEAVGLIPEIEDGGAYAVDAYYNLAEAQVENGLEKEAEASYRLSLEAAARVGDTTAQIEARIRLGSIIAGRGQSSEALPELFEALRLARLHSLPCQEIQSLLALARAEGGQSSKESSKGQTSRGTSQGQSSTSQAKESLEAAAAHLAEAVELAEEHKTDDLLPAALEALSGAKAAAGQYDEAYAALERSVELAHTFSCAEATRRMAELAAGFRLDKAKRDAEIERSRREGLESANERLRMVSRIGRSLTASLEPREILRRMWEELSSEINMHFLAFGIIEPESKLIEFPAWIMDGSMREATSVYLNDESSLAALCAREKRSLYFATSEEALAKLGKKALISFGPEGVRSESILYLPLFKEREVVGILTVQEIRDHAYSADIIEMIEAVASFTAIAVQNARIMISLNEATRIIAGEREAFEKAALESSWLADHDSLTGLFNRRFLERILDENIRLATLKRQSIAIFFIDLDNFKRVNDEGGHDAGDRLLVSVSKRLLSVFRETDYVARVGGDEFIVVAPGLKDRESIAPLADKLISSFGDSLEGQSSIGITVGVSLFPNNGKTSGEIIDRADEAMYAVKRRSKGSWQLYAAGAAQARG